MAKIDFNKLVRDMIDSAKKELTIHYDLSNLPAEKQSEFFAETVELTTTLKIEVKASDIKPSGEIQNRCSRVVCLTVEDLGVNKQQNIIRQILTPTDLFRQKSPV